MLSNETTETPTVDQNSPFFQKLPLHKAQKAPLRDHTHTELTWGCSLWGFHTPTHMNSCTCGAALWWDIILSFSMLRYKMYLPGQSVSSNQQLCPCLVFPSRLRTTAEKPRALGDGTSVAATLQTTPKTSLLLPRLLFYPNSGFVSLSLVAGWDHRMNFLSGHHVDRNDDLVLQLFKFLFLSGLFLGITSEKPYLSFSLLHAMKIVPTQQYGFCIRDLLFSHYEPFFQLLYSDIL